MERKIHSLVQGSAEWLAHRANYWNASDAPAMMGVSPYKTRSELLAEKATGLARDVDDYTQGLFNDGHRFEGLARPLAEEIIGTDLYPVSMSLGKHAASLDGITMIGDIQWEHKSLNDSIRAATCGADLPLYLRVQMEHQYEVSGATRCLFQATSWGADDKLKEEIHFWYESDPELRQKVIAGWAQFELDLANYQPQAVVETPQANAIIALPALAVQIRGEVITSNLPAFRSAAEQYIASIKTELETDEDFVNAAATANFCDDAEKRLAAALDGAIAQMSTVDEVKRTVEHLIEQFRTKRLALDKLVEKRKKEIKETAVEDRRKKYAGHIEALNNALGDVTIMVMAPDFAGAIKGLKTIASANDKLDTALANGKIAADAAARDLRTKLDWYQPHSEAHGFLFRDLQQIIQKPGEDFQLIVQTRIDEHKRAEEEKANAKPVTAAVPVTVGTAAPVTARQEQLAPWVAPVRTDPVGAPSLRLGQINERLAPISLTADGLATLGFAHAATDKAAKLYHESDFPQICAALIRHIESTAKDHTALRQQAA